MACGAACSTYCLLVAADIFTATQSDKLGSLSKYFPCQKYCIKPNLSYFVCGQDAVEEKQRELLTNPYVRCMLLPAGALLAFVFFVPLCLCLWRFALYGPGSFPCQ